MAKIDGLWLKNIVEQEVPTGAIDGVNTSFTLSSAPNYPKSVFLYANNMILRQTSDYSVTGVNITFVTAPPSGTQLYAIYLKENG